VSKNQGADRAESDAVKEKSPRSARTSSTTSYFPAETPRRVVADPLQPLTDHTSRVSTVSGPLAGLAEPARARHLGRRE